VACNQEMCNKRPETLRVHFDSCEALQRVIEKERKEKGGKEAQNPISSFFKALQKDESGRPIDPNSFIKELWTLVGVSTNITPSKLASNVFVRAMRQTLNAGVFSYSRRDWAKSLASLKKKMIISAKEKLKGNPVCLIIDGWRVAYGVEHGHALIISDWNGTMVYHKFVCDTEKQDSAYIESIVQSTAKEVEDCYGVRIMSVVSDNARVLRSAWESWESKRPLIVHMCSAHWFQLLMSDINKSSALVSRSQDVCASIRRAYASREFRITLKKTCEIGGMSQKSLARPCITRWNSILDGMISIIKLQSPLLTSLGVCDLPSAKEECDITITNADFSVMKIVAEVLIPIATATDMVQASLSGIIMQHRAVDHILGEWSLIEGRTHSEAQKELLAIARKFLEERRVMHQSTDDGAIHAVFVLSVDPSSLSSGVVESGKRFILERGPALLHYASTGASPEDDTMLEIKNQLKSELALYFDEDSRGSTLSNVNIESVARDWKLELFGEKRHLAQLMKILLSVRASEAAAERVFSHAALCKSSLRNRLGSDTLDLELFVRVNSKWFNEQTERISRKKRKVVASKKDQEETDYAVIIREETLTSTKCIPLSTEDFGLDEIDNIMSCEACGDLFEKEGYVQLGPESWWRCCACLSIFCGTCSDSLLDDETGLCHECDEEKLALRSGKRPR
jgi:hypothetical protein